MERATEPDQQELEHLLSWEVELTTFCLIRDVIDNR